MGKNITEFLTNLQELTNKNLEILSLINKSFNSKSSYLTTKIGDEVYTLPSFIHLENKINSIEDNFYNLVNVPSTGTADFVFDGNTQSIHLSGYSNAPNETHLHEVDKFNYKSNNIFKDILNPLPYCRFDIESIPLDINSVLVKKIALKNNELIDRIFINKSLTSFNYTYEDSYKILYNYKFDIDYIEYDTQKSLPIRDNIGYGIYNIEKINENYTDDSLDEFYNIKLSESLDYWLYDKTIQKPIKIGDKLVTYDDKCLLEITNLNYNTNTIEVKVLNGGYINLTDKYTSGNNMSKLKYFSSSTMEEYKYVDVTLEEDDFVLIFVAPINNRLHIRSPWGTGIAVNTSNLTCEINNTIYKYKDFYSLFVNNLGDTLFGLTQMFNTNISNLSIYDIKQLNTVKPTISNNTLKVVEINNHLNNATSVKNIRNLYSQKQSLKIDLSKIQVNIDNINNILNTTSFENIDTNRVIYENQLKELNAKKEELNKQIADILVEINNNANDSDTPIENAKYRIRGYVEVPENVIKLDIEYRYRNKNLAVGDVLSINGDKFLFSEWNIMNNYPKNKHIIYTSNDTYKFDYQPDNSTENEPSFNQIDIPITQGEIVDIKVRYIYDKGYPFIKFTSDWSEITSIDFPDEYLKSVPIMDILNENADDIKKEQFNNILVKNGTIAHISDNVIDQTIIYYHKPEHIASGFYTEERRIVPLKDKLESMSLDIETLKSEVIGASDNSLRCSIIYDDVETVLSPYKTNVVLTDEYASAIKDTTKNKDDENNNNFIVETLYLQIANNSNRNLKLFSLFPGNETENIYSDKLQSKYKETNYQDVIIVSENGNISNQRLNQYLYFRKDNIYTGKEYYKSEDFSAEVDNILYGIQIENNMTNEKIATTEKNVGIKLTSDQSEGAYIYPFLNKELDMNIDIDNYYKEIKSGETIIIPLIYKYALADTDSTKAKNEIEKTMSFDIRTSLYEEPTNYIFKVKTLKNRNVNLKVKKAINKKLKRYEPKVING